MRHRFILISRNLDLSLSAPKCNYNLALALARLGVDVEILTSIINISKHDYDKLINAGVKIKAMPRLFARRALSPIAYSIAAKLHKDGGIVIGNGYTIGDDITWVHFLRIPALRNLANVLSDSAKNRMLWEARLEKMILRSARILWAVSNMVKQSLVNDYGIPRDKIFMLHNGVDIEKFHPLKHSEREELKTEFGLREELILAFVGADPYLKGFDTLLRALKKIKSSGKYVLLAIGFKPSKEILYLSEGLNVKYLGKMSEEKLIKIYQITDFLVLLSRYDSFPLVVLEAMACGSIPILSKNVGASEILIQGLNGFVVRGVAELVQVLSNIVNSDGKLALEKMRENAIKTAKLFSWDNIAQRLVEIVKTDVI
jgi:UDP-glucose:(heptosyl)LPS alpha-1,3-glucosyltransferase